MSGHNLLAVPVGALDGVVRDRTAFYDASFVSTDPGFVHAHITVLYPWKQQPTAADLRAVARIARDTPPFDIELARIAEFPDGLIYLVPEPDGPLRRLTARVAAEFTDHPPYEGRFPGTVPHLTLDRRSATVTPATVREAVGHLLPVAVTVDRIDLQRWANHDCRLLQSWPLGGAAAPTGPPREGPRRPEGSVA